jgi:PIN domain nuclease of toxin-antitoxin system
MAMQRLLLDTHVLLWAVEDSPILGLDAREVIVDPRNQVFVSAASVWEIAIKRAQGKLSIPESVSEAVKEAGFAELPVTFFHAEQAGALPPYHRDPFDRMLVAQAQAEGLVIVTQDANIPRYGVRSIRAG